MQRLCKSNAIKLALIAEMPPILCKDTVFLSHRQTSWIILTQRLRVSVQKYHNAPFCGLFAKPANFIVYHQYSVPTILQVVTPISFLKKISFVSF